MDQVISRAFGSSLGTDLTLESKSRDDCFISDVRQSIENNLLITLTVDTNLKSYLYFKI